MEPLNIYQRAAQIKRINTLMSACKLIPNRPDILALWGVARADDLSDAELLECGQFMEAAHRGKTTQAPEQVRRLRSQAMTLINRMGKYATPSDWSTVNRFLLQRKICGRLLYMLDASELRALVRKLRAIQDKRPAPTDVVTPNVIYYPLASSTNTVN